MQKKEARKVYKEKRINLSRSDRNKMDDLMLIQFQRLTFADTLHILCTYWPIEILGEFNPDILTRYLHFVHPGLQECFPKIDLVADTIAPILVNDETEYLNNKYNIPEPVDGKQIEPADIDIIFVPLLAFDADGYRVGYGKGYYDRFLPVCKSAVITIGFSYFDALDKIDDRTQYDVPLNYCITPHRLYEF